MKTKSSKYYYVEILIIAFTMSSYFLALSRMNFWWLLWFAPLPLLIYSFYEKGMITFLIAFISNFFGSVFSVLTYYSGTSMPLIPLLSIVTINSLCIAGVIVLNSIIITKWKSWLLALFFPAAMVSYNFFSVLLAKGLLIPVEFAFTQYHFTTLIQLVSITGIWGIGFLLNFVPNAVACCWFWRREKKLYLPIITCAIILFSGAVLFGYYYISQPLSTTKTSIGIAARDYPEPRYINDPLRLKSDIENPKAALAKYIHNITILAKQGAQYILQPEHALFLPLNPKMKQDAITAISNAAQQNHVTVLFSVVEYDVANHLRVKNHTILFSPQGKVMADYYKMHLVSFVEYQNQPQLYIAQFPHLNKQMGIAICHDMDYIDPAKEYGAKGTGLLFVPAGNFGVTKDGWWHTRIALVQSIANGYSLAQAGSYGYLTLSDYHGRIIAIDTTKQDRSAFILGNVPLGKGNTFYARFGNWFAWLSVILAFLIILILEFTKPNEKVNHEK